MEQTIQKWGNSLAVRIPKAFAEQVKIREGSILEISVEAGRVVLTPQLPLGRVRPKYSLEEMLEGITDENLPDFIDWGPPVGKENWVYDEPEPGK